MKQKVFNLLLCVIGIVCIWLSSALFFDKVLVTVFIMAIMGFWLSVKSKN